MYGSVLQANSRTMQWYNLDQKIDYMPRGPRVTLRRTNTHQACRRGLEHQNVRPNVSPTKPRCIWRNGFYNGAIGVENKSRRDKYEKPFYTYLKRTSPISPSWLWCRSKEVSTRNAGQTNTPLQAGYLTTPYIWKPAYHFSKLMDLGSNVDNKQATRTTRRAGSGSDDRTWADMWGWSESRQNYEGTHLKRIVARQDDSCAPIEWWCRGWARGRGRLRQEEWGCIQ